MADTVKINLWLSALLALGRAEGEISESQEVAIRKGVNAIIKAIEGDFSPMTLVEVWAAYKEFEGETEPKKFSPKALKRIAELEQRVTALEAR